MDDDAHDCELELSFFLNRESSRFVGGQEVVVAQGGQGPFLSRQEMSNDT